MTTDSRAWLLAPALVAAAALGLIASGCGGSSGEGVARVDSTETTTRQETQPGSSSAGPAAYSACMRRNGVPNFPDPDADGGIRIEAGTDTGIDPSSHRFKAAERKCQSLAPRGSEPRDPEEQARRYQQALRFSACMRENGLPNFPDPETTDAGPHPEGIVKIPLEELNALGLNPESPKFRAALAACRDRER